MKITIEIPDDKHIDLDDAIDRLGKIAVQITTDADSKKK